MLSFQGELIPALERVNSTKEVLDVLASRGVEEGDALCVPAQLEDFLLIRLMFETLEPSSWTVFTSKILMV